MHISVVVRMERDYDNKPPIREKYTLWGAYTTLNTRHNAGCMYYQV